MPRNAQQTILGGLQQLNAALEANSPELPHLEATRVQFDDMVTRTLETFARQGALIAEKQEASRELQNLLTESSRLANVLRGALKSYYGIRSEKLAEFGIKVFRGRKQTKPAVQPPAPETDPDPETPPPTIE